MPDGRLGVMQAFPGRVVTLWPDGTAADDYTLEAIEGAGFRLMRGIERAGDNVAIVYGLNDFNQETMKFKQTNILRSSTPRATRLTRSIQRDSHIDFASPDDHRDRVRQLHESVDDRRGRPDLRGADPQRTTRSTSGARTASSTGSSSASTRSIRARDEEKAELEELYERLTQGGGMPPNTTYEVETIHPCINWRGIYARPDGSMWVATSRGTNEVGDETLGTFDIYDPKGRFVRQAKLNGQCNNDDDAMFFVGRPRLRDHRVHRLRGQRERRGRG